MLATRPAAWGSGSCLFAQVFVLQQILCFVHFAQVFVLQQILCFVHFATGGMWGEVTGHRGPRHLVPPLPRRRSSGKARRRRLALALPDVLRCGRPARRRRNPRAPAARGADKGRDPQRGQGPNARRLNCGRARDAPRGRGRRPAARRRDAAAGRGRYAGRA